MLPNTVEHSAGNVSFTSKFDIETLVKTALPTMPNNLLRIKNMLSDMNVSTQDVSQAISYELGLVPRILRLANSSIYSLERSVTSIPSAINVIGANTLNEIVMIEIASSAFNKGVHKSKYSRKIWEHSLTVALIARELSRTLEFQGTEEAFTCGLLHDIGKMILLSADFEGFSAILKYDGENEMLAQENQKYGYTHPEIGALVARRWGLPEDFCYTILHHHNPSQGAMGMVVTHIVDVADMVANLKGYGLRVEDESKLEHSESVMKLGFTNDQLNNIWNKIQCNIESVIKVFTTP